MTTQQEFLQEHAPDGELSPEAAAQFLELVQGETGAPALETGSAPDAATAAATTDAADQAGTNATTTEPTPAKTTDPAQGAAADAGTDPANAVVLAKDGKHTIPYSKLVEARDGEKHWKAQAETAQQELVTLRAQAEQRAATGAAPTQTDANVAAATEALDKGVDPAIFGDFSEEAIAKGIQKLQEQTATTLRAEITREVLATVKAELAPLQQKAALTEAEAHAAAIYAKHPDADSLVESKELADWIAAQPSFARAGFNQVLQQGTAAEVIELFDEFKKATGATPAAAAPAQVDVKAAAKAAIDAAKTTPPVSLTDIPGGRPAGHSFDELMANKTGPELIDAMSGMSPAQIEAYLNRQM